METHNQTPPNPPAGGPPAKAPAAAKPAKPANGNTSDGLDTMFGDTPLLSGFVKQNGQFVITKPPKLVAKTKPETKTESAPTIQPAAVIEEKVKEKVAPAGTVVLSFRTFDKIKAVPVKWSWRGYLALGKLTTFSGEPGHGKSMIAVDVAARITTGRDFPDGSKNPLPPSDVLIMTVEEDAGDTIKPRFLAAGGDPTRLKQLFVNGKADNQTGGHGRTVAEATSAVSANQGRDYRPDAGFHQSQTER